MEILRKIVKEEKYSEVIDKCCEILKTSEDENVKHLALLLRGTFYILNKQQNLANSDLTTLIDNDSCHKKIRSNALIKRASLTIQACKDPVQDPIKGKTKLINYREILK